MLFLFNRKSSLCSWDIQIFVIFSRGAIDFCSENSETIQEYFKNTSLLFEILSDIENIIATDLKVFGFFKKA